MASWGHQGQLLTLLSRWVWEKLLGRRSWATKAKVSRTDGQVGKQLVMRVHMGFRLPHQLGRAGLSVDPDLA